MFAEILPLQNGYSNWMTPVQGGKVFFMKKHISSTSSLQEPRPIQHCHLGLLQNRGWMGGGCTKVRAGHHGGFIRFFFHCTLRLHGMSWGVKTTCFKAPGVSLGGSGVSIGGVRILRVWWRHNNRSRSVEVVVLCCLRLKNRVEPFPMPCMVYLPTFTPKKQPTVGKYTIHGWYGFGWW